MLVHLVIAALLVGNTCFYLDRQFYAKRYRLSQPERVEIKVINVGYLVVNLICMCLTFFI